jgi:pimeloyl-ACP methyl ester carboxylesterase
MSTWPAASDAGDPVVVRHKTTTVDRLSVFYREAGDPRNPTLVLLHEFSSSSVMFRDLMPRLAGRFHLLVPDYPGSGAARPHRLRRSDTRSTTSPRWSITFWRSRELIATPCTSRTMAPRSDSASPVPTPASGREAAGRD